MASKKNKSFADQAKKIMSKYALRPDDNASKTAMNRELDILKEEQEIERQQMAQEAMETLNSLGIAPPMQGAPQEMPPEMAMQQGQGMPQQMPPQQEMMGPPPQGMPMQQAYGGKMCGCGKRGCKGCGGKMKRAYGGNLYAEGGILNTTEDTPKKREQSSKVKDFIAGLKFRNRDVSQPFLGQEAFTALQALKDYGYAGDPAVITSMLRGKGNKVFKKGSWHNKGRAFDISAKEDSEKLIDWTKSEQGQKWLSDFGIDYIDETSDAKRKAVGSKGTAPHHHFEFEKKYNKLNPNIDPERLNQLESEFTEYKDNRNLVNMKDYPGFQSKELPPVFIKPTSVPYQPDLKYVAEQESTAIQAYGGNMRKKYYTGGPLGTYNNIGPLGNGDDDLNEGIPLDINNTTDNYLWDETGELGQYWNWNERPVVEEEKNKPKDKGNTFDGKMDTGDYIAAGIGALPDIAGLAYAAKKPEKRGRMTAQDETLDTSAYDQALARNAAQTREISRRNPNAALSQQVAGSTAANTGIGAARASAEQQMEARNIQRQMGVDQFNLSQDERDRQAMDARMNAMVEHGKGITGAYTGVKGDKDKMAMEAKIANMLGTDNYEFQKNADGTISIVPKK